MLLFRSKEFTRVRCGVHTLNAAGKTKPAKAKRHGTQWAEPPQRPHPAASRSRCHSCQSPVVITITYQDSRNCKHQDKKYLDLAPLRRFLKLSIYTRMPCVGGVSADKWTRRLARPTLLATWQYFDKYWFLHSVLMLLPFVLFWKQALVERCLRKTTTTITTVERPRHEI